MCNYQYQNRGKKTLCFYPQFYRDNSELFSKGGEILMDEEGYCIFHSDKEEWKLQNGFLEILLELIVIFSHDRVDKKSFIYPKNTYDFSGFKIFTSEKPLILDNIFSNTNLKFSDTTIANGLIIQNSQFGSIDLQRAEIYGTVNLDNVVLKQPSNFSHSNFHDSMLFIKDCIIEEYIEFDHIEFSKEREYAMSGIFIKKTEFNSAVSFSSLTCYSKVIFENIVFFDSVNFNKSEFNDEFLFRSIEINSIIDFHEVNFALSTTSSPLYAPVDFNFIKLNESGQLSFIGKYSLENVVKGEMSIIFQGEPTGLLVFENFNVSKITKSSRDRLFDLEKIGKVQFGKGCKKYYCQTEIYEILASHNTQILILDIVKIFCNYFEINSGKNLGIDIIERNDSKIRYYYFTDEEISKDDFLAKIKKNEIDLWHTFANITQSAGITVSKKQKNIKNCLIDLAGLFLKIGNELSNDYSQKEDLFSIFNFISLTQNSILDLNKTFKEIENRFLTFNATSSNITFVKTLNLAENMSTTENDFRGANIGQVNTGHAVVNSPNFMQNIGKTLDENNVQADEQGLILSKVEEIKSEKDSEKKENKWAKFLQDYLPTLSESAAKALKEFIKP